MLRNNRVLFFRQGAFRDLSHPLSDINESTSVIDFQVGDFLYIGSDFPFNHRYFDVTAPNAVGSVVSVDVWSGTEWEPTVDVLDETSVGGASLARSGIISWSPDWDVSSWGPDETNLMDGSGLETGPKILGLYWARVKFSVTLTNTTALNIVGHKFSSDADLETEYPELASSAVKTAWESGKTDWNDQTLTAAEYIIQDLRGEKNLIISASQILDWKNFQKASVHKTAQIIFRGFGDDYADQTVAAAQAYKSALNVGKFNIDQNKNAILEPCEKVTNVTFATR